MIGYFGRYHFMVYKNRALILHNIKKLSTFERLHKPLIVQHPL